jgi:hypothetical protein
MERKKRRGKKGGEMRNLMARRDETGQDRIGRQFRSKISFS